jgi:hypothetical protein
LDFFIKINALIRISKLILLIRNLHFKGLERSMGDAVAAKKIII